MKCMFKSVVLAASLTLAAGVSASELAADIQNSVKKNWSDISETCQDMMELVQEMPKLPDRTFIPFKTDKQDQRKKIRKVQLKIREILLSADSQKIMQKVDRFNEQIAQRKEEVAKLTEELQFYPENREKLEKQINEENDAVKKLTANRDAEIAKVQKELDSIGLHMQGSAGSTLFSLVNRGELIDNVIVAKSIYEIVNKLQGAMRGGDVLSAKRYFGVYVALTDVQILCYEQYLEKSQKGEWRQNLAQIEKDAQAAVASARECIGSGEYTPNQCEIFQKNIAVNNKMVYGVGAYRKLLDCHEKIIAKKLADVNRMRKLAYNSYSTVAGAASFAALLQSSQAEFSAVLELSLPELEGVDDGVLQEQLQVITNMLDK